MTVPSAPSTSTNNRPLPHAPRLQTLSQRIILQNNPDPKVLGDLAMALGKQPGTVDVFYNQDTTKPATRVATITPGAIDTFTVLETKSGVVIDERMPKAHQESWNFPGSLVVDPSDGPSRVDMPANTGFNRTYFDAFKHLQQQPQVSTWHSPLERANLITLQGLCPVGGEGTRMWPLTQDIPKPALPIEPGGTRLLQASLAQLHTVDQVHVTTRINPEQIDKALGKLINVQPVHEGNTPLGDFGLVAKTLVKLHQGNPLNSTLDPHIDLNKPLLMVNGDAYISGINFADLLAQHTAHHAGVSILARHVPAEQAHQFGILSVQPLPHDNPADTVASGLQAITAFTEKPDKPASNLASTGIVLLSPEVLKAIPGVLEELGIQPTDTVNLGKQILPALIERLNQGQIIDRHGHPQIAMAQPLTGTWLDVGNHPTYFALYRHKAGLRHDQPLIWPDVTPHPDVKARGNVLIRKAG